MCRSRSMRRIAAVLPVCPSTLPLPVAGGGQPSWPAQTSATAIIKDFRYSDGTVLAETKRGYVTIGSPKRDIHGDITNAVLLLHGASGTSSLWLSPKTGDPLFSSGTPLHASKYFIIMP